MQSTAEMTCRSAESFAASTGRLIKGQKRARCIVKSRLKSASSNITFQNHDLEIAFNLSCHQLPQRDYFESLSIWRKRIDSVEIGFIDNPQFRSTNAEQECLGGVLLGSGLPSVAKPSGLRRGGLPTHLANLCEAPLLSPNEELELFRRMNFLRFLAIQYRSQLDVDDVSEWQLRRIEGLITAANWYRDTIVKANMRLVVSIVKKFVNLQNGFDDLLSDGIMALIRAVDKFDYSRGFRFSTYATLILRRNTYRNAMIKQSERLQVSTSIDESGIDVCAKDQESTLSIERWNDLRSRLAKLLGQLDRREKLIVRARFSLGSHRKVQTLQSLADKLGVSKERVRQLEKRALDKLRCMVSQVDLAGIEICSAL